MESRNEKKNIDHPNYTLLGIITMALGLVQGSTALFLIAMVLLILGETEFTPNRKREQTTRN